MMKAYLIGLVGTVLAIGLFMQGAADRWHARQAQYSDSGASCSWEQGTRYDGGPDGRQPTGDGHWEVVCR